ncbi:hypothetical protein OEZ85_006657 [Tetradesmus obliquus]|uniref:Methyltransferase type 11 domain-containing protein n=1 Tax=Tetradesmus obliquus TaxID=3088 RepID=A0ABY8TZD5_TETOB|nr:hypothetical protein OEZ85_006657 [Tetradesmus obliquus]
MNKAGQHHGGANGNCTSRAKAVSGAYNSSSLMYKMLRAAGWGPLTNLGFYSLLQPFQWLSVPAVQTALVRRVLSLGRPQASDRILDVACGRGKSTYMMACAAGNDARVVGLDLLPQNVSAASWLYGGDGSSGPSYVVGDATALDSHPAALELSPTLIYCIEAAFHFDRPAFLAAAARVLSPGGRLVVVDFAWREAAAAAVRAGDLDLKAVQTTRSVWQFEDFSTEAEYCQMAAAAGLAVREVHDWTGAVMTANKWVLGTAMKLARSATGRAVLGLVHPDLKLTQQEWAELDQLVHCQLTCLEHVRYIAYVFERSQQQQQQQEQEEEEEEEEEKHRAA